MELRIRKVDKGAGWKRRSIATELHGKTRNQKAQAEERLDLRIREGDEGVG